MRKTMRSVIWFLVAGSVLPAGDVRAQTERFDRPIPMGVSISTTPSLPFIFAGTAGMRVRSLSNPSRKFILSNNHVIGAVGPSLCPNTAPRWTWILQPGTLDIGSDPGEDPFFLAGVLDKFVPMSFGLGSVNLVDGAKAFTTEALSSTQILNIGDPTPELAVAALGMAVTKSGRTTGVTNGTVAALNVTALVSYEDCGTALFVGQVSIEPGEFSSGGDSGSVILESATLRPIGLLFAGGATNTLANPIAAVYILLGVFVDGPGGPASLQELVQQVQAFREPRIQELEEIQARNEEAIMRLPGVVGIGIGPGRDKSGLVFKVYCDRAPDRVGGVPERVEGIAVELIDNGGPFRAYR